MNEFWFLFRQWIEAVIVLWPLWAFFAGTGVVFLLLRFQRGVKIAIIMAALLICLMLFLRGALLLYFPFRWMTQTYRQSDLNPQGLPFFITMENATVGISTAASADLFVSLWQGPFQYSVGKGTYSESRFPENLKEEAIIVRPKMNYSLLGVADIKGEIHVPQKFSPKQSYSFSESNIVMDMRGTLASELNVKASFSQLDFTLGEGGGDYKVSLDLQRPRQAALRLYPGPTYSIENGIKVIESLPTEFEEQSANVYLWRGEEGKNKIVLSLSGEAESLEVIVVNQHNR